MRKLILKMSFSIDGLVGGLNGENDWIFRSSDEFSLAWAVEKSWEAGIIVMGRKSFEQMAPYWPTAKGPFAAPMNELPKGVFTQAGFKGIALPGAERSPAAASWTQARIFHGDLVEEITKLKSEAGKPIYAIGGAGFARSLLATDMIDEYHLVTHPVILGRGLSVFGDVPQPRDLKLVEAKSFPGGIIARVYQK